ncbi:MAG: nucleotidyl transferase AbiEii/AbiGii toxin family protein [Spirochaetales bacterium]|nr:nucleotidyl transferase AbiEii/AbiGii toxin family protein [Spirochaetales bacterium]
MKERIREIIAGAGTAAQATLLVREYLQARVLEALQRAGAFGSWAFLGGTALRFLYRLPRFSEDLGFSRVGGPQPPESLREGFARRIDRVRKAFEAEAYLVELRHRPEATVQSAFVGFPGLLFELELSPHRGQKISIKVEVDTRPPVGAATETSLVRRHVLLNLLHYDKASLLAAKLHALIHRPCLKGRDLYDLLWYLSDPSWPEPNLPLLRASLAQTGMELSDAEVADWRGLLEARLAGIDWNRAAADLQPFLERSEEISLLSPEHVLPLLRR